MTPAGPWDDELLDGVADELAELVGVPPAALPARLRPVVQRALTTWRPDGTWPETDVVLELLRAYVDLLDEVLDGAGLRLADLPGDDARFVEAVRECATSPSAFADLLADLRAEIPG